MSAVVAGEGVVVAVVGETDVAVWAFWYVSALGAFHVWCESATVLE